MVKYRWYTAIQKPNTGSIKAVQRPNTGCTGPIQSAYRQLFRQYTSRIEVVQVQNTVGMQAVYRLNTGNIRAVHCPSTVFR